jgi:hypothetical protein
MTSRIEFKDAHPDWKDCYIVFRAPTFTDVKQLQSHDDDVKVEKTIEYLKSIFIEGKGWDGTQVVDIAVEDIGDLPMKVLTLCFTELAGEVSPKGEGG